MLFFHFFPKLGLSAVLVLDAVDPLEKDPLQSCYISRGHSSGLGHCCSLNLNLSCSDFTQCSSCSVVFLSPNTPDIFRLVRLTLFPVAYLYAVTGGDDSGFTMPPRAPCVCVCVWVCKAYAHTHPCRSAMYDSAHTLVRHTLVGWHWSLWEHNMARISGVTVSRGQ